MTSWMKIDTPPPLPFPDDKGVGGAFSDIKGMFCYLKLYCVVTLFPNPSTKTCLRFEAQIVTWINSTYCENNRERERVETRFIWRIH